MFRYFFVSNVDEQSIEAYGCSKSLLVRAYPAFYKQFTSFSTKSAKPKWQRIPNKSRIHRNAKTMFDSLYIPVHYPSFTKNVSYLRGTERIRKTAPFWHHSQIHQSIERFQIQFENINSNISPLPANSNSDQRSSEQNPFLRKTRAVNMYPTARFMNNLIEIYPLRVSWR